MFVCLDVETTGLKAKDDEIIEIAIVLFDREKIIKEWSSFVRPSIKIPEFVKKLTGIKDEDLKNAPLISELEEEIKNFIDDKPIVGHFINFDINFLSEKNIRLQNLQLDTCQIAQVFLPGEGSYSLEVLTERLGIKHESAHRAMEDVKANIELFWKLEKHLAALTEVEKQKIIPLLQKSSWQWANYIIEILNSNIKGEKINEVKTVKKEKKLNPNINLTELCKDLGNQFFLAEASHNDLDILNFAIEKNEQITLVTEDPEKFPVHESIQIIKDPNQYLNLEAFNNLLKKEKLDTIETMLAIKISLWLEKTKTFDKFEIKLFKEENLLWSQICRSDAEPVEIESNKKIFLISHLNFLKDRVRKNPLYPLTENLIIARPERMCDEADYAWHIQINLSKFENETQNEKISILHGLLGIFLNKFSDQEKIYKTLIITTEHRNTTEWKKILECAKNTDSEDKYIQLLINVLMNKGPLVWLTLDRDDQVVLHIFPQNGDALFKEKIWNCWKNIFMFSHHTGEEFSFIQSELSLPKGLTVKKIDSIKKRPLIYPKNKISPPNDPQNFHDVLKEMTLHIQKEKGDAFILVSSNKSAEQFFYGLNDIAKENNRKLFVQNFNGGLGKIQKMSEKTAGSNIYVGNEEMLNFLLDENIDLVFLAIQRLPFPHPNDPIQSLKSQKYENSYEEYVLPKAALKLQRILDKFLENDWSAKSILILDPRLSSYERRFLG